MKKALIRCVFFILFSLLLTLQAGAKDDVDAQVDTTYDAFLAAIPEEVRSFLPQEFFTCELENSEEVLQKGGSVTAVLSALGKLTGLSLTQNLALLAQICGVLLISAVFRSLSPDGKRGPGQALGFCSTLVLTLLLLVPVRERLTQLETYFATVKGLSTSFLPLMGLLYAMGGNVRAAAVNHSVMSAFLSLLETLCAGSVMPVAGVCLALALLEAVTRGSISLQSLSGLIKRTYTLSLSFLMLLLCGVLGLQSTLAKAGDTLALRTARFAAGSFLPVVGGSVSETLRTVAGSVEYLRSVAGSGAILVVFFAFLPTFLSLFFTRLAFLLGGSVAGLLHCEHEKKLLSELASVYGYFLAVIASLFVMLIFSLTLFARAAAAGG